MTGGARVRPATLADWPAAQALLREGDDLHAALAPDYFRSAQRGLDEWRGWLAEAATVVLLAEPGGDGPAGLVVVRVYDTPKSPTMVPRRRGHVDTLVVAARHRRKGLGRRLMDEASAWARRQGAVELVLTTWTGNAAADAFYERLGYRSLSNVLSRRLG